VDSDDEQFTLAKVSLGTIGLYSGVALLSYGFGAYFTFLPGGSISALLLIYGFPATLLGFALKYAELKPVKCRSTREALALRGSKATDIQNQIRSDVTRFRYGDEQHLDEALKRIFRFGRYDGIPRKMSPVLTGVREEVVDGEYALVLEFAHKKRFEQDQWVKRLEKITTFFGPGIRATVEETAQGADLSLICDGTGEGRGGGEKGDVLPPLMPGLPARQK